MPLPTIPHHSHISHCFFFNFITFYMLPFYEFIFIHTIRYPTSPLHISISYFHVILSLPLMGKHPPLTISQTLAPTLPSAKLSFLGLSFIRTYSFSLSVSLKPSFHALLPLSCILSQIYFFHPSRSTFIHRFTILRIHVTSPILGERISAITLTQQRKQWLSVELNRWRSEKIHCYFVNNKNRTLIIIM